MNEPTSLLQAIENNLRSDEGRIQRRRESLSPVQASDGLPFMQRSIDLSEAGVDTAGKNLRVPGFALLYRREGSAPGGKLKLSLGGDFVDFCPGMFIRATFDQVTVIRAARGAQAGFAQLVVFTDPDATLEELYDVIPGEPFEPVDLLGSSVAGTFVAVTEDTQPSGAAPAGSWLATGWRRFRVLIDGTTAAAAATSFDLIPWVRDPNSGIWFEQGVQRIGVPDSGATGYRYREVILETEPAEGLMYLEIRNLLAAGRTGLGYIVQGIG